MDHAYALAGLAAMSAATAAKGRNGSPENGQWPAERARRWYEDRPVPVGCNFLPSTAVNDIDMWQRESYDPETIDTELGYARRAGLNSVRVFLNYVVWQADPAGLRHRFEHFLDMANRHGLSVMPILFDDCAFAGREPELGEQPDPVPGVHNSGWVPSPGLARVTDPGVLPALETYVKDIVGTWAKDRRVWCWDLYNEPGNSNMGEKSLPLVEATFAWARAAQPTQPLTSGVWVDFDSPMSRRLMELSDLVSFHGYGPAGTMREQIALCKTFGRPILCTEWLFRQGWNTPAAILPIFAEHRVGCWNWGLVAGRTQTYMPWGSKEGDPEPAVWQHDLLRPDGTPYRAGDLALLARYAGRVRPPAILLSCGARDAAPWRIAPEAPPPGWEDPGFDDSGWPEKPAPFGKEEAAYDRFPGTEWETGDIALRRTFILPERKIRRPVLVVHHDNEADIRINGIPAARLPGFNACYEEFGMSPESSASLHPGENLITVRCRNTEGGRFIDVGIADIGDGL